MRKTPILLKKDTITILAAQKVWMILYDRKRFLLRKTHADRKTPLRYNTQIYYQRQTALNKAKKLNTFFNTDKFTVVRIVVPASYPPK